ncbi:hypothetical protein [Arthrobacter methylotrophus]|uniref:hypothetical protein n=1 Tax=Arthrobacter methylotrophus TaxID=121291 RepID=UPI0031EC6B02
MTVTREFVTSSVASPTMQFHVLEGCEVTDVPSGSALIRRESAAAHHMMLKGGGRAPVPATPEHKHRDTATGVRFWVFKCK